jgi:hypothetical protein
MLIGATSTLTVGVQPALPSALAPKAAAHNSFDHDGIVILLLN